MSPAPTERAWQRMLSGRRLDLLDPSPLDIEIEDIAVGLARVARWNGQTTGDWAFSVAQHCLLVEALLPQFRAEIPKNWRLLALLHDAPEYVVGDLITPFKNAVNGDYRTIEEGLMQAIRLRFGMARLPKAADILVKRVDRAAAYIEAIRMAGFPENEARVIFDPRGQFAKIEPTDIALHPLPPNEAEARFLERFQALCDLPNVGFPRPPGPGGPKLP